MTTTVEHITHALQAIIARKIMESQNAARMGHGQNLILIAQVK